jgi:hypothetical protein
MVSDSKIDPSMLIPLFRRQSTMLDLCYCHALILANRPSLLASLTSLTRNNGSDIGKYAESIDECVSAALTVVQSVHRLIKSGNMLQAFWFTQYVCFCAVVVLYVHAIQGRFRPRRSDRGTPLRQSTDQVGDGTSDALSDKFAIAEQCQQHIATATKANSLGVRYNIVLEELRLEVLRQSEKTLGGTSRDAQPQTNQKTNKILDLPPLPHGAVANTGFDVRSGTNISQSGTLRNVDSTWGPNGSNLNKDAAATKQDSMYDWARYQDGGDDLLEPQNFSGIESMLPDNMADILGWGQFDAVVSELVLSEISMTIIVDIEINYRDSIQRLLVSQRRIGTRMETLPLHTNQSVLPWNVHLISLQLFE